MLRETVKVDVTEDLSKMTECLQIAHKTNMLISVWRPGDSASF